MHIVILPSELYIPPKSPLAGIFQHHHVMLLREYGHRIGVISAGLVPFAYNFRTYPYPAVEKTPFSNVYRNYTRIFIPGRFAFRWLEDFIVNQYVRLFAKYIQAEGKPDLIHAHNCIYAGAAAKRIKERYQIPYVITEHSTLYQRHLVPDNQVKLACRVMQAADARTVVSNALGQSLNAALSGSVLPATTIYNVLEEAFEKEAQQKAEYKSEGIQILLSIGSLEEKKNHQSLIRAFANAFRGKKEFELHIGGTGPDADFLKALADELDIQSQVKFLGYLNRVEVAAHMKKCAVFVLPSLVETFGVVLIEALSFGKPCIATICGGPEEIINDFNGYLVEKGNDEALTRALLNFAANEKAFSPEKIKTDLLERFGRAPFYNRLLSIYQNVIN